MSVKPDAQWFFTAHHELGHVYYFLSYSRPEVPYILRQGANRAMHEAVGDLASIAAKQPAYLEAVGVLPKGFKIDAQQQLVDEALTSAIPFVAWSAGTMAHFEHDLYQKDLPPAEWQKRWWKYVADFQGVAPPSPRPADGCDACTKTHINDNPAAYYQYAIAAAIKYQLHDHICKKILHTDPHSCSYYGHKEVGDFLRSILKQGATRPFNDVMREATGEPLSTQGDDGVLQAARRAGSITPSRASRSAGRSRARSATGVHPASTSRPARRPRRRRRAPAATRRGA